MKVSGIAQDGTAGGSDDLPANGPPRPIHRRLDAVEQLAEELGVGRMDRDDAAGGDRGREELQVGDGRVA